MLLQEVRVDFVTVPEISRQTGHTRPQVERIITQYAHELPPFKRVGITRIWPPEIIQRVLDIFSREARCASGAR